MHAVVEATVLPAVAVPPRMGSGVLTAAFFPGLLLASGEVMGESDRHSAAGVARGAHGRSGEPHLLLPAPWPPAAWWAAAGSPELGWEAFAPGRSCWWLRNDLLLPRAWSRVSTSPDGCCCGFSDETQPPNACNLL